MRQHVGTSPTAESCRAYSHVFLEAVNTRHVASICEEGADRQRDLALLDADIDALTTSLLPTAAVPKSKKNGT